MVKLELSIVVPCYNEEAVLGELHQRLTAVCRTLGQPYEIILVNDGSEDRTWPIMTTLADEDSHVVAVNLSRNHGHQLALTAGLSVCRGARVLIIDADLQDPPELLAEMLRMMDEQGADVVYGQRRTRSGETRLKVATAAGFYRLIEKLTDVPIPRDTGDFRLMSRRALDVLASMPERHRFIRGMVSWIGLRQVPLLYDRQPRFAGTTKYPLRKMIRFAVDAITAFSIKPLQLASLAGVASASVSLALAAYSLIAFVLRSTVTGWTSLMAVITFIGSVQLLVMGVFGEYLGRMYEEVKGRPLFIISDVFSRSEGPNAPDRPAAPVSTMAPDDH